MSNKAFSLIELMVVIAIVALLAAVAVPVYKMYTIKATLTGQVLSFMDDIAARSQVQFETTGQFANNADLDLPISNPPNYVFPYIAYLGLNNNPPTVPGDCHSAQVLAYVSNYDGDFLADNVSPYTLMSITLVEVDGVMQKFCTFMELDPTTGETTLRDTVNGCTKETDDSNFAGYVTTYIETACQ